MRRRAAAALGAAAVLPVGLAVALGRDHSTAAPREPVHALVYARATDRNGWTATIFRARTDGSHAVAIARGTDPLLSPDGRLVAFVRYDRMLRAVEALVVPTAGGA